MLLLVIVAISAITCVASQTNENTIRSGQDGLPTFSDGHEKGISLCKECESVVSALKKALDDPETAQSLINTLNKACDLPVISAYKEKCLNIVQDTVVILHQIQGLLEDSTALCAKLQMCSNEADATVSGLRRFVLSIASKIVQYVHEPPASSCQTCASSLNHIKQLAQSTEAVEAYRNEAMRLCSYAGLYEKDCEEIVDDYAQGTADVIVDVLCDPETMCEDLTLCDAPTNATTRSLVRTQSLDRLMARVAPMQTFLGINMGCLACKASLAMAIRMLDKGDTVEHIAAALKKSCDVLPSSFSAGCRDFMEMYSQVITQMLLNEWTPAKICTALNVCSNSFFQQIQPVPLNGKSFMACTACKLMSKVVAHELQQSSVQQDVVNTVITHVCDLLPGSCGYKDRCNSVVQTYLPYALEDIVAVSYIPKMCTAYSASVIDGASS